MGGNNWGGLKFLTLYHKQTEIKASEQRYGIPRVNERGVLHQATVLLALFIYCARVPD
jgi:hypothetical protein